ncbi:MAG: HD domain-containing phosphohydrolase [Peptostreptococcaceae bacterium]
MVKNNKIISEKNVLQTIIDNVPEIIFYKDKHLKYIGINKPCKKFYNDRGIYDIIGKSDLDFPLDKEFIETCINNDRIVLDNKQAINFIEYAKYHNRDEYQILETTKTPVIDEDGNIEGLVGVVRDITEQTKLEKKLRYMSYTDQLTGLYNRSYFDEKIKELAEKKYYPIGVITGDVNGLKIVNDTLGHLEGDKLLKLLSTILKGACNENGFVFRWGGDEFITILPNATEDDCINFIAKVNYLCDQEVNENFKLSISHGYSFFNEGSEIDDVLRASENEAYKVKMSSDKSIRTSMLLKLKNNLQLKNLETQEHTNRVSNYCMKIGKKLNFDKSQLNQLLLVAQLHDIGKIGIPEKILLKPGNLSKSEFEIMKTHSEKGYRLALLLPELSHIAREILTHHERWDGKGYPLGLEAEEIPLNARIISVVDAFDAITHDRPYQKGKSKDEAIDELKRCSGKQFDPNIVDLFCKLIK